MAQCRTTVPFVQGPAHKSYWRNPIGSSFSLCIVFLCLRCTYSTDDGHGETAVCDINDLDASFHRYGHVFRWFRGIVFFSVESWSDSCIVASHFYLRRCFRIHVRLGLYFVGRTERQRVPAILHLLNKPELAPLGAAYIHRTAVGRAYSIALPFSQSCFPLNEDAVT